MPLLAYFWKIGAALLALLFVADFCLRGVPLAERKSGDQPTIRIQSDRKWPERVTLDTSSPTFVAPVPETASAQAAPSDGQPEPPSIRAETPAIANALAMTRTDELPRETVDHKRPRKTQHIATRSKRRAPPQMLLAARQGQFAWFGYRYW